MAVELQRGPPEHAQGLYEEVQGPHIPRGCSWAPEVTQVPPEVAQGPPEVAPVTYILENDEGAVKYYLEVEK